MLQAWHSEAIERYDFSWDSDRLEVKASTNRTRTHHFSYDQVYPPRSVTVVVASLFVQSSPTGRSIKDLWDQLRAVADDSDLRLKLERICLETLGDTWQHAVSKSYDEQIAEESLAFFDIANVPKVSEDQPSGVSDIRFRSDLSETDAAAIPGNRYSGRFFSCLRHR